MALNRKIWWLLPIAGLLLGSVGGTLLYTLAAVLPAEALKEGAIIAITLALTIVQLFWIIRAYPIKLGLGVYALVTGLFVGVIAVWLHRLLEDMFGVTLPPEVRLLRYLFYPMLLVFVNVTLALKRQLSETERRYALQQDAAALLKEAELFKLRQQLQPHFLFNSLNAISALIIAAPDKAAEMISRLADFLRTAVKQGRSETVPITEELDYLRQYLWIEAVRFGERLHIEWTGELQAGQRQIPPLLLQPIMENAIRHAVYGGTGVVTISVMIESNDELLRITIRNPYDAAMKALGGTGFGLSGIRRRLWLVYGRQDLLQTTMADGHFTTSLLIPQ